VAGDIGSAWALVFCGQSGIYHYSFIIITMPIYLLGIGLYIWAQGIVKNEITNSALSNVTSYLSDLENEFLRIKSLQNDCVVDQNLNMIVYRYEVLSNYDWTIAIIGLGYRLMAIKNSSTYIDDVCVHQEELKAEWKYL